MSEEKQVITPEIDWRNQIEGETHQAWMTFQEYRNMPPVGVDKRSYKRLATKLGKKSTDRIEIWARENHWQSRVKAFDNYMSNREIEVREANLDDYRESVLKMETQLIAIAGSILLEALVEKADRQKAGIPVDPMDIKRLTSALGDVSNLARRAGSMATSYRQESAEDVDPDAVFIVGGNEDVTE